MPTDLAALSAGQLLSDLINAVAADALEYRQPVLTRPTLDLRAELLRRLRAFDPRRPFRPGDRVEMTEAGLAQGLGRRARTATVVGWWHDLVVLVRDGLRSLEAYSPTFWRLTPAAAPPPA